MDFLMDKKNRAVKMSRKIGSFLKKKKWLIAKISLSCAAIFLTFSFFMLKTASAIYPVFQKIDQPIDENFRVQLNQTLRDVNLSQIKISPKIDGKWQFESGGIFGRDELIFIHEKDFVVNTEYSVDFGEISRVVFGDGEIPTLKFKTEIAPPLAENGGFLKLKDGETIAADYDFRAELKTANKNLRRLEFRAEPKIEFAENISDDQFYTWKPKSLLPQGQNLTLEIFDTKNNVSLAKKTLKIADEPSLKSALNFADFGEKDVVKIEFNQEIAKYQDEKIVFDLAGVGKWENLATYVFTPEKVEAGKTYTYHIKSEIRSVAGGILTHDIDANFTTVGARTVVASSPHGRELSQSAQQIKFTFDRAVNHASAEKNFSISSGKIAGFSWSGNTLIATVRDLGFQQTVSAQIAAGVENDGFGLPTAQTFGLSFTTEIPSARLNIPVWHQNFAQSCEESSLRMALAYRGIGVSDEQVLYAVGYDARPSWDDGGKRWTDPDKQFVGDVHGSQTKMTGYGVFAGPIVRAANHFGRGAEAQYGVNANWLAQQLYNNNPVVLWGIWGSRASHISWTTPEGRQITAPITTHTRIVVGVKGSAQNPLGFWINDPATGTQIYWTTAQLLANSQAGVNQAVAVF